MEHDLICTWLGLTPGCWPPDHYRLLGLDPGETDTERIEAEVQHRLEIIRRYQLINPEQATEAMNRLAQAFVCLTDAEAKKTYDAQLRGQALAPLPPIVPEALEERHAATLVPEAGTDVLDVVQPRAPTARSKRWQTGSTPPSAPRKDPPATPVESAKQSNETTIPALDSNGSSVSPPVPAGSFLPDIPLLPAASTRSSATGIRRLPPAGRRGWGTRRALYQRLVRVRQLREAWEAAVKYVGRPTARATRPPETAELNRQLSAIRDMLESYPPSLGEAGQPGQLVAALARQQVIVPTFQSFIPSQREALARDWEAGQKHLAEQQISLRAQLRKSRRKNDWPRGFRIVGAFVRDHPTLWLVTLALLALLIASRDHRSRKVEEQVPPPVRGEPRSGSSNEG